MHLGRVAAFLLLLALIVVQSPFYRHSPWAAESSGDGFSRAEALLKKKQYAAALEIYETLLTRNPALVAAYRGLVACYSGLGDAQGALVFIEGLFFDHPEQAEISYGLGFALFTAQQYKRAAHYFDQAIAKKPDLAEAWNNRAAIYQFVEKDTAKARQYYNKAIELAQHTDNVRVIEIARQNMSHLPEEEVLKPVSESLTLEQFLNRFVTGVEKQDDKALRELVLGQRTNCEQAMDWLLAEALKGATPARDAKDSPAFLLARLLAKTYGQAFNDNTLKKKLERFESFGPDGRRDLAKAENLLEKGRALERKGRWDDAAVCYEEALTIFKKLNMGRKIGIVHVYRGDVYSRKEAFAKAQSAYTAALPYFNREGDAGYRARILVSKGQACFRAENYEGALDSLTKALKIYRQLNYVDDIQKLEQNIEIAKKQLQN